MKNPQASSSSDEDLVVRRKTKRKRKINVSEEDEEQPGPSSICTPKPKRKVQCSPTVDILNLSSYNNQLPVTCGDKEGTLDTDKLSRGESCIESEGNWFTPAGFEKFGGKDTNKKWKISIYFHRVPLQRLFEKGHLTSPCIKQKRSHNATLLQTKRAQLSSETENSSSESEEDDDDEDDRKKDEDWTPHRVVENYHDTVEEGEDEVEECEEANATESKSTGTKTRISIIPGSDEFQGKCGAKKRKQICQNIPQPRLLEVAGSESIQPGRPASSIRSSPRIQETIKRALFPSNQSEDSNQSESSATVSDLEFEEENEASRKDEKKAEDGEEEIMHGREEGDEETGEEVKGDKRHTETDTLDRVLESKPSNQPFMDKPSSGTANDMDEQKAHPFPAHFSLPTVVIIVSDTEEEESPVKMENEEEEVKTEQVREEEEVEKEAVVNAAERESHYHDDVDMSGFEDSSLAVTGEDANEIITDMPQPNSSSSQFSQIPVSHSVPSQPNKSSTPASQIPVSHSVPSQPNKSSTPASQIPVSHSVPSKPERVRGTNIRRFPPYLLRRSRAETQERRRERREALMLYTQRRNARAVELLSSKLDTVIALLQRLADSK